MRAVARLSLSLVAFLVACGDDGPGDPLYGTWNVTKSEYVSAASPEITVDLVADGGSGTLELNADASYSATIAPAGKPGETTTGTWSFTESSLTMRETGSTVTWSFDRDLQGDTMALTGAEAEYDFDDDGTPEPATWNVTLQLKPQG